MDQQLRRGPTHTRRGILGAVGAGSALAIGTGPLTPLSPAAAWQQPTATPVAALPTVFTAGHGFLVPGGVQVAAEALTVYRWISTGVSISQLGIETIAPGEESPTLRGVVLRDRAGSPGELVAATAELPRGLGVRLAALTGPAEVAPGACWLGVWCSGDTAGLRLAGHSLWETEPEVPPVGQLPCSGFTASTAGELQAEPAFTIRALSVPLVYWS
jgi:hypothetical protein